MNLLFYFCLIKNLLSEYKNKVILLFISFKVNDAVTHESQLKYYLLLNLADFNYFNFLD